MTARAACFSPKAGVLVGSYDTPATDEQELRIERGERRELSGRLVEIKRDVRAVTFYSGRMASFAQLHRSRTCTGLTAGNIGGVD